MVQTSPRWILANYLAFGLFALGCSAGSGALDEVNPDRIDASSAAGADVLVADVSAEGDDSAVEMGDVTPLDDVSVGGGDSAAPEDSDALSTEEDDVVTCNPDECDIAGDCYGNQEVNPEDPCLACHVVVARDAWSPTDGGECDDGDLCTTGDTCWEGACVGTSTDCPETPCVTSTCDPGTGQCHSSPSDGSCDDGNACTLEDTCELGVCVGSGDVACDDQNPCTVDACDPTLGCIASNDDGAACDDGSLCSVGDACMGGVCTPGNSVTCDDGSLCTVDFCHPVDGCQYESIADLCTDENPCTDAMCDAELGCVFPSNTEPCDDGSECSVGDTCTGGVCLGLPIAVDDGNPCTDDTCVIGVGILNTPNGLPCDDADACSVGDICVAGACESGDSVLDCDDENGCTVDSCDAEAGCVYDNTTDGCDDLSECTDDDACSDGECVGTPVSCDDGNPCTTDACVDGEGCQNTLLVSNACRPQIAVSFPPRGATLEANNAYIDVTGTVSSGAGDITSVTINGDEATVDGDSFTASLAPEYGGNTLVIEATDTQGTTRKRVQAFHWAPEFIAPDAKAEPGIGIWMAQSTIDDGDHSLPPNDLATIFELVLAGYPLGGLISGTVATTSIGWADYDVNVSNFSAGPRSVGLETQNGKLKMTAVLEDLYADVKLKTNDWAPDFPGHVDISKVTVTGDVLVSVVNHQLVADLSNILVEISGLSFTFDSGAVDFLLGWLADILTDGLVSELEDTFAGEFASQLEPLLADALGTLAFSTSFDMPSLNPSGAPVSVALETDFGAVSVKDSGAEFQLRASASAPDSNSYDNLGAVARSGCGVNTQTMALPKSGPFEIGFSDDTFNLLLYAAWQGGLLEFEVPPEMLADVDLSQYGIGSDALTIHMSGMLAPVVTDCSGEGLVLHVGDLMVTANLEIFGQSMDVEMYASFSAGVSLSVADGVLGIEIEEVQNLDSQIAILQEELVGSEAGIAALIDDNLVPALLGALGGGALGGFPLPEIALTDEMLNLPPGTIPAGTAIGINPQSSSHDAGNVFISGTLK
ncbi:MAG: hypothetical protein ACPGU1_07740 [Myxococcota bacterium]